MIDEPTGIDYYIMIIYTRLAADCELYTLYRNYCLSYIESSNLFLITLLLCKGIEALGTPSNFLEVYNQDFRAWRDKINHPDFEASYTFQTFQNLWDI